MEETQELDSNARQRRETFARYGLAMYHAQCVEKSLAILVSCVFNKEFLKSTPDQREEIQEGVFSKTIGHLLSRLKKQISIPPHLGRMLIDAMKKRNWLAHDYFWERAGQILTPNGRDKMIDELTNLIDFFSKVDEHLMKTCDSWCKKVGIQAKTIDEGIKRLIRDEEKNL
jgi:hypothetical protein